MPRAIERNVSFIERAQDERAVERANIRRITRRITRRSILNKINEIDVGLRQRVLTDEQRTYLNEPRSNLLKLSKLLTILLDNKSSMNSNS